MHFSISNLLLTVETSASVDEEDDVDGNRDFLAFCLAFRAFEPFQTIAAEGRKGGAEAGAGTVGGFRALLFIIRG